MTFDHIVVGAGSSGSVVAPVPVSPFEVEGRTTPERGFGCMAGIITPHSRGRLWLNTRDARDHPVIDPAVLSVERLRVCGVRGLRVADAAIFPAVPSGTTHLPCIMVGEKAADLLLDSEESR